MISDADLLAKARASLAAARRKVEGLRAARAAEAKRWNRQLAEFQTWRPTPTRAENNALVDGELVMLKQWDLSPVDQQSFDPTEPPRPGKGGAGMARRGQAGQGIRSMPTTRGRSCGWSTSNPASGVETVLTLKEEGRGTRDHPRRTIRHQF